jgi:hypothetical protein
MTGARSQDYFVRYCNLQSASSVDLDRSHEVFDVEKKNEFVRLTTELYAGLSIYMPAGLNSAPMTFANGAIDVSPLPSGGLCRSDLIR